MVDASTAIQRERMNGILKALLDHARLTRGRLGHLLRMSPSSIVKYTRVLIEKGLVKETAQAESTGGRRSQLLELNPEAGLSVCVTLDVSATRGAVVDMSGRILAEDSAPSRMGIPREELLSTLGDIVQRLLGCAQAFRGRILGIGVGMGGHIDPGAGISHEYLYATDWYDVPLRQLIEERFPIPCYLVNDANSCALGEKYRGMAVGVKDFICVTVSEGVGMGIVANGELYLGKDSYAGEFGHVHAVDDGALCYCGHTGCLETVCSQSAILAACRDGFRQGVASEVLKHSCGDRQGFTIEHVICAANNGDRFARNVLAQAADVLGTRLADAANLLNPELIVLRGTVIDGNEFLFDRLRRIILDQSLRPTARGLRVQYSPERKDIRFAGIASAIVMEYLTR